MDEFIYGSRPGGRLEARVAKKEYLQESRVRLERDVLPYLTLIKKKGGGFGFWAMVRMLMPVVEDIGLIQYPNDEKVSVSSGKVLNDLGVPFPHLTWLLFRNSLLHRDELTVIIHEASGKYAGWRIGIGSGHKTQPISIEVDVEKLYYDLYAYIGKMSDAAKEDEYVFLPAIYIDHKKPTLDKEYIELFGDGIALF